MTVITLLTQADCPLCEHATQVLDRVGASHPLTVTEVDLHSPAGQQLAQGWVLFAPGVLIDGQPFAFGRLSERKLRRKLSNTASTASQTKE